MVLLLKQWKSRSSPGFAGGAGKKPIHDVFKAAGGDKLAAALLFEALALWTGATKSARVKRADLTAQLMLARGGAAR